MSKSTSSKRQRHSKTHRNWKPAGARHRAMWNRQDCKKCGVKIIMAEELMDTGRLRATLIDAEPNIKGGLIRNEDGYIIRDFKRKHVSGNRYLWHNCPVRNI